MFSKIIYTSTFVFALMANSILAQEISLEEWNKPEYEAANSAKNVDYMSDIEKETIRLMNCARMNGKLFARTYLIRYIQGYNPKKTNYLSSLIDALETATPSFAINPSKGLCKSARDHAKDLGTNGITGHTGSDGSKMANRIERYVEWGDVIAENCSYGTKTALDIVCTLLIDEGVVTLGHRKNILSKEHKFAGVAIEPHSLYKTCSVTDFAGAILSEK